jgi:CRP-like cAMP-binding protein
MTRTLCGSRSRLPIFIWNRVSISFTKGEPTPFFVVMEGTTEVLKGVMGRRTEVSEHKQGDFFGESAILMATAAPASVRAKTACHLARLDPQHLQEGKLHRRIELATHRPVQDNL